MKSIMIAMVLLSGFFAVAQNPMKENVVVVEWHESLEDRVYAYETMTDKPTFKGEGVYDKFKMWIRNRTDNQRRMLHGSYHIAFIVDKTGRVGNVEVRMSPTEKEGERLAKIIRRSPSWCPGMVAGEAVNTQIIYKVTYTD